MLMARTKGILTMLEEFVGISYISMGQRNV